MKTTKTYWAVIEICKSYVNGSSCDTFLWQKPCKTKTEASQFIEQVSSGVKGLYSVNKATIEVD